jgi:hypothetical protein
MEDTTPNKEYSFELKRITLLEKNLNLLSQAGKLDEFAFDVSLQIGNNPESKECLHIMKVGIKSKKTEKLVGSIQLLCAFFIQNFEEYISEGDKSSSLPKDLLYLLNSVIIGTMRGVMFSEFRGTVLNNAFLPVLDPRKFEQAD